MGESHSGVCPIHHGAFSFSRTLCVCLCDDDWMVNDVPNQKKEGLGIGRF
jgi:hypothetical protein